MFPAKPPMFPLIESKNSLPLEMTMVDPKHKQVQYGKSNQAVSLLKEKAPVAKWIKKLPVKMSPSSAVPYPVPSVQVNAQWITWEYKIRNKSNVEGKN